MPFCLHRLNQFQFQLHAPKLLDIPAERAGRRLPTDGLQAEACAADCWLIPQTLTYRTGVCVSVLDPTLTDLSRNLPCPRENRL